MDLIRYQTECQNTKSTEFFGDRVTKLFLKNAILEAVESLTRLDAIKKSLFYGKPSTRYPVNGGFEGETEKDGRAVETCAALNVIIIDANGHQYHVQAGIDLIHAIVGKATEASELLEALYTAAFNGQPLDVVNIIEEIGDGFWYDAIALHAVTSNFHEAAARNNAKLKKRFPNKFTTKDAIERDTAAERELLEMPAYLRQRPASETAGGMLQRLGIDADVWAKEFIALGNAERINEVNQDDAVDIMRAWLANAIEAGRMAGREAEQKIWLSAPDSGRDQYVMQFIGWLSGAVCELHSVEVPRLADAYRQFKERYAVDAATDDATPVELSDRIREENAG